MRNLLLRQATIEDLPEIIRLIADDFLGAQRENFELPLHENYINAFREIEADANNELIVAVLSEPPALAGGLNDVTESTTPSASQPPLLIKEGSLDVGVPIIGTLQLTYTPSLSFQGGRRCTVESVRVDEKYRSHGIGREMMLWAIERAREKGCVSMQLTTHKTREKAHRFYEKLGFTPSHIGMKLKLK